MKHTEVIKTMGAIVTMQFIVQMYQSVQIIGYNVYK